MIDSVDKREGEIIYFVAMRGNTILQPKARSIAESMVYLSERNLLVPVTPEQAGAMDSEALRQCRAFCSGWKEWTDGALKKRIMEIHEMLIAFDQGRESFMSRRACAPISGWSSSNKKNFYTKEQWRAVT